MKTNKSANNRSLLIAAVLWLIAITFILVIILLSYDSFYLSVITSLDGIENLLKLSYDSFYLSVITAGFFLAAMIASLSSRDKVFLVVTLILLPVMAAIALPGYINRDSLYLKLIQAIEIVFVLVLFVRSLWVIYQELLKHNES